MMTVDAAGVASFPLLTSAIAAASDFKSCVHSRLPFATACPSSLASSSSHVSTGGAGLAAAATCKDRAGLAPFLAERQRLVVLGRAGGVPRPSVGAPAPRFPRKSVEESDRQRDDRGSSDGTPINNQIRAPLVRLVDEEQNMVGIVPTQEALQRSRDVELDLVLISPDADPPVAKIMDYSKFKYESAKRKREQQKKSAANRMDLKELKMRYNIDTHDYDVRLRAAQRFLRDGDRVRISVQFKGREMEFKDLGTKLFERFERDLGNLALVENKLTMEGRSMVMVFSPNKLAIQKLQAQSSVSDTSTEPVEEVISVEV